MSDDVNKVRILEVAINIMKNTLIKGKTDQEFVDNALDVIYACNQVQITIFDCLEQMGSMPEDIKDRILTIINDAFFDPDSQMIKPTMREKSPEETNPVQELIDKIKRENLHR